MQRGVQPFLAVVGRADEIALGFEIVLQAAQQRGIILDNQDRGVVHDEASGAAGRVMMNVLPRAGSLSTRMAP